MSVADMTKCRELLKITRKLVTYLTDAEIDEILIMYLMATERMIKEQENEQRD